MHRCKNFARHATPYLGGIASAVAAEVRQLSPRRGAGATAELEPAQCPRDADVPRLEEAGAFDTRVEGEGTLDVSNAQFLTIARLAGIGVTGA